jgi:hypothetical protein
MAMQSVGSKRDVSCGSHTNLVYTYATTCSGVVTWVDGLGPLQLGGRLAHELLVQLLGGLPLAQLLLQRGLLAPPLMMITTGKYKRVLKYLQIGGL